MSEKQAKRARRSRQQDEVLGKFRVISQQAIDNAWTKGKNKPLTAFQFAGYLAAIYKDSNGSLRLTINRTRMKPDGSGRWDDGITWDTIQKIKSDIGLSDYWGVEIYPPDDQLVDVANMRHIFLFESPPPGAWVKK